jgi:hypothetical protein
MKSKKNAWSVFVFFIFVILMSGCLNQEPTVQPDKPDEDQATPKPPLSVDEPNKKEIVPLSVSEGEFGKIIGWLNDETIVYFTNLGQGSTVYSYELFTGKSSVLFKSEHPIISIYLSDSRKNLLIHTAPNNFEGEVTVIDQLGSILATQSIISSEITFAWNPYNENLVLISAFTEDWDFQVYLLDIPKRQLQEVTLPQPFASWITSDEVLYLDWDMDTVSHFAPLVKQKITDKTGKQMVGENLFQLNTFTNIFATIAVSEDEETSIYSFFTNKQEPLATFAIPHLTKFSDWLVPYNDLNQKKLLYYTLRPLTSGEADSYNEGFQLVSYPLGEGNEKVIMDGLENQPISISPNGEYCLYGFQFEHMIDLQDKKIIDIIKE